MSASSHDIAALSTRLGRAEKRITSLEGTVLVLQQRLEQLQARIPGAHQWKVRHRELSAFESQSWWHCAVCGQWQESPDCDYDLPGVAAGSTCPGPTRP